MISSKTLERAKANFNQANELKEKGMLAESIACYQKAIQIKPDYTQPLFKLAEIYEDQEDWTEAVKYYQRMIDLDPENHFPYLRLARVFKQQNKVYEAISAYQKAITLKPDQPAWVYMGMGEALNHNGQIETAITAYHKAIENLNTAIDSYKKAIEIKPDLPFTVYKTLGKLLKLQEKTQKKITTEKYKVVVCATFKNEAPYILEWIAYHRIIKIDHFLIYNNDSTDNTQEILKALDRAGIITYVDWPSRPNINNQIVAYKDAYLRLVGKCEWITFIDGDEFIVPNIHQDLPSFLSDYENVAGICVNWNIFGSSGHINKTNGLVMERFKKCARASAPVNRQGKTIAKIDFIEDLNIHKCKFPEESIYIYPDRTPVPELSRNLRGPGIHITHEFLQINHYVTKSKAEWELKRARGRADKELNSSEKIRSEKYFEIHDKNNAEDIKILKFLEKTKQEIKFLIEVAGLNQVAKKFFE